MSFKPTSEIVVKADYTLCTNPNNKRLKHNLAANGEMLVSKQELQIYNLLLEQRGLHIEYEAAFSGADKTLYPDFTILNVNTQAIYIWEHLGMTNSEKYLDQIPDKLVWYESNGLKSIEKGGNLVLTFYNEPTFYKDVEEVVQRIIDAR
jgi:hypothetical protein